MGTQRREPVRISKSCWETIPNSSLPLPHLSTAVPCAFLPQFTYCVCSMSILHFRNMRWW